MKILILGSEGFIGSHCIRYFSGISEVSGVDLFEQPSLKYEYRKISRLSPEVDELFESVKPDVVINAAGSGNVPYSMSHPIIDFESNVLDTIRVLDSLRKYQPWAKYIHLSSAAVYGNPAKLPIYENDMLSPMSPYGWHKLLSENICREYSSIFNIQTAIVRPFSVYGPGLKKQMFWDLFQKIRDSKTAMVLHGSGAESRDYIFVEDLVAGIHCIINSGQMKGETYNLASGEETMIRDVVRLYFKTLNYKEPYRFNGVVRPGDPLNWKADISKIRSIGFVPSTKLENGLQKVSEWLAAFK